MSSGKRPSPLVQILVSFVIPLFILSKFSSENSLGPTKGFLLALAFPVAYEIYSIQKKKKLSMFSVLAIGGIMVTGLISILGLSEGWLALRRSIPYAAVSAAILISMKIHHPIIDALLPRILDMDKIKKAAKAKHNQPKLTKLISNISYYLSGFLMAIAILSYVVTRIIILSPAGTNGFNQEYAKLRIISLPFITLPILIGLTALLFYLTSQLEKLTGLKTEDLLVTNKK